MPPSTKTYASLPPSPSRLVHATALLLTTAVLLTLTREAGASTQAGYTNLLTTLFTNYSVDVRPVNNYSEATDIYLAMSLLSIVEVNEKEQTLKSNILLDVDWTDDYLSWTPSSHEDIETFLMRQKLMWVPDIVVSNTVSSLTQLGYDNLKLRIESSGLVYWSPTGIFETACDIDITYYPFDTQVCNIEFRTSMSRSSEIYVYIDRVTPIDLTSYSSNGLWDLIDTSAENLEGVYDGKTKIRFQLQLQRRRSYYILNVLLPIIFLSLTSSMTFALPSDAGEKMGLSITVLLAFAVYLTLLNESMPTTSVQISVVTVYLVILLAITAASVLLSVLILRLHHRPPSLPVTGCLATVIPFMRNLMCMDPIPPEEREEDRADWEGMKRKESEGTSSPSVIQLMDGPPKKEKELKGNSVSPAGSRTNSGKSWVSRRGEAVSGKRVAETLDRFIFLVFSFLNLGSTFVCILLLFIGAAKQETNTKLP